MPKLIKNNAVCDDDWLLVLDAEHMPASVQGAKVCLPFELWQTDAAAFAGCEAVAVWLNGDAAVEVVEKLSAQLAKFAMLAIHFPVFSDGRGYSLAQSLRARYGYAGELRAIGDVLPDQLLYMQRVGFDAFSLREDKDPELALARFEDFSETYQAAADQQKPLFARRTD